MTTEAVLLGSSLSREENNENWQVPQSNNSCPKSLGQLLSLAQLWQQLLAKKAGLLAEQEEVFQTDGHSLWQVPVPRLSQLADGLLGAQWIEPWSTSPCPGRPSLLFQFGFFPPVSFLFTVSTLILL